MNSGGERASAAKRVGVGAGPSTAYINRLQRRPSLKFRMSFKSKKTRQAMVERTCNELALEGERFCREGRWEEGIERLESAARAGTQDLKTLSALYSQLGNAYFYMENYSKSLEYHKQDLTLARSLGDRLGEAKACGNIGSALKALGQFDESVACCRMQLDIAREISDKVLESRALYNLGNVYHARGKSTSTVGLASNSDQHDAEDFVKASLAQAARHYEANLKIVRDLGDYQAQGRTLGNLGNTYYLLGNYKKAIKFHEERLSVAELLGDKVACRRAYSNLGNAQMFLGKYSAAAQYYLHALEVAREVGDIAFEAQSCYSLGNTYTLIQNYPKAIEFHMRHLQFAVRLDDRIGECRAYWSLGNSYTALGDHRQARHFANKHLQLSVQLGDEEGIETAKRNLADLDNVLELSDKYECPSPSPRLSSVSNASFTLQNAPVGKKRFLLPLRKKNSSYSLKSDSSSTSLKNRSPRDSRAGSTGTVSPTSSLASSHDDSPFTGSSQSGAATSTMREDLQMDDGFLDMISKSQSRRLDDQRTSFPDSTVNTQEDSHHHLTKAGCCDEDDLFETLWRLQGARIDDQRCDMPSVASPSVGVQDQDHWEEGEAECLSSDELFDMIFECQSSRINDQRSPDPRTLVSRKSTMPSEDFFNLIQHLQSTRIEDQRSPLPVLAN